MGVGYFPIVSMEMTPFMLLRKPFPRYLEFYHWFLWLNSFLTSKTFLWWILISTLSLVGLHFRLIYALCLGFRGQGSKPWNEPDVRNLGFRSKSVESSTSERSPRARPGLTWGRGSRSSVPSWKFPSISEIPGKAESSFCADLTT